MTEIWSKRSLSWSLIPFFSTGGVLPSPPPQKKSNSRHHSCRPVQCVSGQLWHLIHSITPWCQVNRRMGLKTAQIDQIIKGNSPQTGQIKRESSRRSVNLSCIFFSNYKILLSFHETKNWHQILKGFFFKS